MKGTVNSQSSFSNSAVSGNIRTNTVSGSKNSSKKKAAKKRLNYNYREISGEILKAKKLQSASFALSRARSKMVYLAKCKSSGQFDSRELDAAIAHAKRMIRCANIKVNNMREEKIKETVTRRRREEQGRQAEKLASAKNSKGKKAAKRSELKQAEQKIRRIKQEILEQKRRIKNHRLDEQSKVLDANMKYIKEGGGYSSNESYDTTAIMELSAMASYLIAQEQCSANEDLDGTEVLGDGMPVSDGSVAVEGTAGGVTITADMPSAPVDAAAVSVDVAL